MLRRLRGFQDGARMECDWSILVTWSKYSMLIGSTPYGPLLLFMCAGAIDGTHVPIKAPSQNHTDYVNRKSYHSIIMQALVDSRYLFRDIVVGWPGRVHDARVLSNSETHKLGNEGALFPDFKETILGQDTHPCILGDPAYPLLPRLLKPFPENQNTPRKHQSFNYRLSRPRMTIEDTFGRWKGRFPRFSKRIDMKVEDVIHLLLGLYVS